MGGRFHPSASRTRLLYCSDPRTEPGYCNGDHEPWVQDVIAKYLKPGDCFYDVGAHTGFFCLLAARKVGPKGEVVGLEADPENAALLRANAARNGMGCVRVVEAAAWSRAGQLKVRREFNAANGTQGHVTENASDDAQEITVDSCSLDDLLFARGMGRPQLLKIDVEGAEWEVLRGAERTLRELRPAILCEVHKSEDIDPIRDFLASFGYSTEHWQPVHARYDDYRQEYVWARFTSEITSK
jgi:FkbM family methyltransferase